MTTDRFVMNGCVCMPKNLLDFRLVEEYLASLHCYLPSMWCCKLLEKRLHIMKLQITTYARSVFLPNWIYFIIVTSEITRAVSIQEEVLNSLL